MGRGAKVAAAIGRHPREFVGIVMATGATFTIFVNALFLQKGPHPAPIFAPSPIMTVPSAPPRPQSAPAAVTIAPPADNGQSRTQVPSGAKRAAAEPPPRAHDPIAQLIAPSKRVLAVQRALADFGYGQLKPTGLYDPETRTAIEKFERDRRLPVTGQISDRLVRELTAMTGRPLE